MFLRITLCSAELVEPEEIFVEELLGRRLGLARAHEAALHGAAQHDLERLLGDLGRKPVELGMAVGAGAERYLAVGGKAHYILEYAGEIDDFPGQDLREIYPYIRIALRHDGCAADERKADVQEHEMRVHKPGVVEQADKTQRIAVAYVLISHFACQTGVQMYGKVERLRHQQHMAERGHVNGLFCVGLAVFCAAVALFGLLGGDVMRRAAAYLQDMALDADKMLVDYGVADGGIKAVAELGICSAVRRQSATTPSSVSR